VFKSQKSIRNVISLFFVLPKFDKNNIFQKFKKNLVKKSLNSHKMVRDVDFQAPADCEPRGLQTKKANFQMATEVCKA
jgi:hypothetical protein